MPKFGKWILTLGLVAATPGMAAADNPFAKYLGSKSSKPAAGAATNQQTAVKIAEALRSARLNRHEMDINFVNGVCTLTGKVATEQQRADATRICMQVPGVQRVDNRLSTLQRTGGIKQAGYTANPRQRSGIQLTNSEIEAPTPGVDNQKMAEQVARSLQQAGLSGYDMEIRYQDGTVTLGGSVSSPQQAAMAGSVAKRISGVDNVNNQLRVAMQRPQQPQQGGMPQVQPAGMYQPGPGGGAMPAPQNYAHGGPGARHTVYNNANLPDHAWPSYASYPNYSQVTYPKQYSASAWPYIGPFYPYPQVPLGWRKATLEWDDGYWALNFDSRTDRWWWFMNPKNW